MFRKNSRTPMVPDYVFEPDYALPPLAELEAYVLREKHLPDMPSAEIQVQGLNMTEFQMALLKKVEELTLYTLAQEKTITTQAAVIGQLTHSTKAQEQTIQAQAATIQDLQGQAASIAALKGSLGALTERFAALEQASARR